MNPRLYYLNHSGFLLELDKVVLVFDYYTDPAGRLEDYSSSDKPLVFLVSHDHFDHWNPDSMDFRNEQTTYYIMDSSCDSERVRRAAYEGERELWFVEPGVVLQEEISAVSGLLQVHVFDSTDAGVSFLVVTEQGMVCHLGDLNDWDWQDEDSAAVEAAYRTELESMAGQVDKIRQDSELPEAAKQLVLACVPVDQRLEETALRGAEIFLEYLEPDYLAPMHLNGGDKLPRALAATLSRQGRGDLTEILELTVPGQKATME